MDRESIFDQKGVYCRKAFLRQMLEHIILTSQLLSDKSMRDLPVGVTMGLNSSTSSRKIQKIFLPLGLFISPFRGL